MVHIEPSVSNPSSHQTASPGVCLPLQYHAAQQVQLSSIPTSLCPTQNAIITDCIPLAHCSTTTRDGCSRCPWSPQWRATARASPPRCTSPRRAACRLPTPPSPPPTAACRCAQCPTSVHVSSLLISSRSSAVRKNFKQHEAGTLMMETPPSRLPHKCMMAADSAPLPSC